MNADTVSLQEIYDSIIKDFGWEPQDENKRRQLRRKYTVLQQRLVLCDRAYYKAKGSNFVPKSDAPIIKRLLIEAMDATEGNMVCDWFNGNVDCSDSSTALLLYMQLKPLIMEPYMCGETNEVTMDEWLSAVSASINHSTARNTLTIKKRLEEFRNTSLALDTTVSAGDIIASDAAGNRRYAMKGCKPDLDVRGKTVEEILDSVTCQDDYFAIFAQILSLFDAHAKERVRATIETYAELKNLSDAEKADDLMDLDSIASEYIIRFQRIHEFLHSNPDICHEIEAKCQVENLADFFKMDGR